MPRRARVSYGWVALLSAAMASDGFAQQNAARLTGTVRDSGGVPVPLAELSLLGIRGTSDTTGYFALAGLPVGAATLRVRRLGFEPLDVALELTVGRIDSLRLVLAMVPRELAEVTTEASARTRFRLADFYRHRQNGSGYFFDRKEIAAARVQRTSDLLRRLPGIRLVPDRTGRLQLRMSRSGGQNCPPDFWIDGTRATLLNVDDIPLADIEALEVYKGPSALPPEYNSRVGMPSCGVVVIWTRFPG